MGRLDTRTDEELLRGAFDDRDAFAVFYARFERPVAAFFLRATGSGELAADLTAEVFAHALDSSARFDRELGTAQGWLFGIARHVLSRSWERGRVEDRARRRLGMPPLALDDDAIARIEQAGSDTHALELLQRLPAEQRQAINARIVEERGYGEIASELLCSESVVRKRVSRGLATLRIRLKENS